MHSNISQFYPRLNDMTVQKFGLIKIFNVFEKKALILTKATFIWSQIHSILLQFKRAVVYFKM